MKINNGRLNGLITLVWFLPLLFGCAPRIGGTIIPYDGEKGRDSKTVTVVTSTDTQTPVPTLTKVISTQQRKITPSPSPTPIQKAEDIAACNKNGEPVSPPRSFGLDGSIVFQDTDGKGLYTIGGFPLMFSKFPVAENVRYQVVGFSPNGEWFAYSPWLSEVEAVKLTSYPLFLVSYEGEKIEKSISLVNILSQYDEPMQFKFWSISGNGWLNNNLIQMQIYLKSIYSDVGPDFPGLLDPFLGEWRNNLLEKIQKRNYQHAVGFSRDFSRILFTDGQGMALMNLDTGSSKYIDKNKYLVQSGIKSGPYYKWSPDSSKAVYGPRNPRIEYRHTTLISRDGEKIRDISEPQYLDKSVHFWPASLEWSSDSELIAITGELENSQTKSETIMLYIYNVGQDQYVYQCPLNTFDMAPGVYWSPDNRYIVPYARGSESPLLLYDIENKEVLMLPVKGIANGWSDKFR